MDELPKEVLSHVLCSLRSCEIASLVSCGRLTHSLVSSIGCLSTREAFAKPVADVGAYEKNLLLGLAKGATGAVTFRPKMP